MKRNQKILVVVTSLIAASAMLWAQAGPLEQGGPAEYRDAPPLPTHLAHNASGTPLAVRFFPSER